MILGYMSDKYQICNSIVFSDCVGEPSVEYNSTRSQSGPFEPPPKPVAAPDSVEKPTTGVGANPSTVCAARYATYGVI